ncbi:tetratricopeptide repeat protein [Denitrificimonas sp. JX-1]|uniref:Tetratricopeptide repeat protein n=1 Tax=Denitrificimonas halotolerans TaxID=3098930 RepID=A0ABU5GSG8_9GAMM|nr:tetratricopeptide repeat protein [Denitrificimonas sp. JX-1]MDY7219166.1 tetratricopeptide repeat protein [Denitrificimonas sp. JX-1]
MKPLFLVVCLCVLSSQTALAQSIAPDVLHALQAAQSAQQAGLYAEAERALKAVKIKPNSLEQVLVWRSQGYLVWAQGHSKRAIALLDKALRSNQLSAEQVAEDRLNLAKLSLLVKNYRQALEYLQGVVVTDEVLKVRVQAWQGLGRLDKALPLAEQYVQGKKTIEDDWLQFMVSVNAELKRYGQAEIWQKQILQRNVDQLSAWQQLATLQQLAGQYVKSLATLRTAYSRGMQFSQADLQDLIHLAAASDQPWQAARLMVGMLETGLLTASVAHQERLALLHWQARDYQSAAAEYAQLAKQTGKGQYWLDLAQLEIQQGHWDAGLQALAAAEKRGVSQQQIRAWRDWVKGRVELEQQRSNQFARK